MSAFQCPHCDGELFRLVEEIKTIDVRDVGEVAIPNYQTTQCASCNFQFVTPAQAYLHDKQLNEQIAKLPKSDDDGIAALIEAFQIFRKYVTGYSRSSPTHCEHDTMYVGVNPEEVSEEDKARLDELGFQPDSDNEEVFSSYRFGSA